MYFVNKYSFILILGNHNVDQKITESLQPPKGIYLHGGVGTGKTLLLDLFYDCLPQPEKKRVHFHSFMLYLYSEINRWNLCCDDDVTMVTPTEHIAKNIMKVSLFVVRKLTHFLPITSAFQVDIFAKYFAKSENF